MRDDLTTTIRLSSLGIVVFILAGAVALLRMSQEAGGGEIAAWILGGLVAFLMGQLARMTERCHVLERAMYQLEDENRKQIRFINQHFTTVYAEPDRKHMN